MEKVIVKDSEIHGKGVFAARKIKKGEVVLRWDTSHEVTPEQVKGMTKNEKRYVTYMDGKHILMQEPERYVNHSCDANTTAKNHCDIAKRDIEKDEEITADYSEECEPDLRMKCNCGSRKCRGLVTARRD